MNSGVTCLAFGENRKARYPGYFFCHGCDLFEDAIRNGNKRAKRTQSKYACTAGHEVVDSGHPTTLHQPYRPARNNSRVVLLVGGDKQDDVANMKDTLGDVATTIKTLQSEEDTPSSRASPYQRKVRSRKRFVEVEVPCMQHQILTIKSSSTTKMR